MNNSIFKLTYFKNVFYLLNKNPNNIELGRWCSSKMKNNNNNVSSRIFELGNSDNCYISNYSIKNKNK